ncbi:MAG: matrixin family metalloprotease [Gemmatimonadota bacterium]
MSSIPARPVRLLALALVMGVAFVWATRPDAPDRVSGSAETVDPCRSPLAWHVRSVDPGFGFTEAELERAVEEAAEVWNRAAGRPLLRRDTVGGMAIDLVYDERQQRLQARQGQAARLDSLGSEVEGLDALLQRARDRVEEARAAYERDPSPEGERTARQRVDRYNDLVERYNRAVARYSEAADAARAEGPMAARAGDLRARSRMLGDRVVSIDRVLTVALAGDYEELVTVLAHELGHALGLGHVGDPDALMAESYQGETSFPVRLTEADRRALAELCEDE